MAIVPREFVVTLVSSGGIDAGLVERLERELAATRIVPLAVNQAIDLFCPETREIGEIVQDAVRDARVDAFVQLSSARRKKLLIADMESTIIEQEMLDELAAMIGIGDIVAEITHRAMNGEIDFATALRERVTLLQGKPAPLLDDVANRIQATAGAASLVTTMKANGAKCWLASGGFDYFADLVAKRLGFDAFFANKLVVRDGYLTGEILDPIFDKDGKRKLLDKARADFGVPIEEIVTVGDGANDIAMLSACDAEGGLGVAFHAKPKVRAVIQSQVNNSDLTALLFAQGYPQSAFVCP